MKQYTFWDRDIFSNSGTFTISGKHYKVLLQKCFKYSKYLSLVVIDNSSPVIQRLSKWKVDNPLIENTFIDSHRHFLYVANKDVHNILLQNTNNMFERRLLQDDVVFEDLVFYRDDGSIFFDSILHEGECSLYPNDSEDISDIIKFGHWIPVNILGTPEIPASQCQLPMPDYNELIFDNFYISLRKIQSLSKNNDNISNIIELCNYIDNYRPLDCETTTSTICQYISFLPRWYIGFKYYLLAQCNAMSSDKIIDALLKAGYTEELAFEKFFELLDYYVIKAKNSS